MGSQRHGMLPRLQSYGAVNLAFVVLTRYNGTHGEKKSEIFLIMTTTTIIREHREAGMHEM